ncbi:MAG TPA: hypothetical protein QF353_01335 [Gammaproteobacteria bacterium]|nr:hypothetical protein [Gammaproteobacteria bacterium]
MIKRTGLYLLNNVSISAALVLLLSALSLHYDFLYVFSLVVMGLITLEQGWVVGFGFFLILLFPFIKLFQHEMYSLFDFLRMLNALLLWLGAGALQHYRSWTSVLMMYTAVLLAVVVGVHLIMSDVHGFWLTHYLQDLGKFQKAVPSEAKIRLLLDQYSYFSTGMAVLHQATVSLFWVAFCSLWYGWSRFSRLGIILKTIVVVELRPLIVNVFWFVLLMGIAFNNQLMIGDTSLSSPVFLDAVPAIVFAPFVVGLVVFHSGMEVIVKYYRKRQRSSGLLFIMLAYTMSIILLFNFIIGIAPVVGIIDYYTNLRGKLKSSYRNT